MSKRNSTSTTTLFDQLGGASAVKAVVDEFYTRLLDDDELSFFFEDTKMAMLKQHQLSFLKTAFNEEDIPEENVVTMLIDKHRRLFVHKGLNETHFDLVAGHFVACLQHFQVPQALIEKASAIVLSTRPAFVKGAELYTEKEADDKENTLVSVLNPVSQVEDTLLKKKATLMDKLGGPNAVKEAVDGMYLRILNDELLAPFFEGTSLTLVKVHMIEFMKIAFQQVSFPDDLDVAAMIRSKHTRVIDMGANESHFDLVAGHFEDSLKSLQITKDVIAEALGVVNTLRPVFQHRG